MPYSEQQNWVTFLVFFFFAFFSPGLSFMFPLMVGKEFWTLLTEHLVWRMAFSFVKNWLSLCVFYLLWKKPFPKRSQAIPTRGCIKHSTKECCTCPYLEYVFHRDVMYLNSSLIRLKSAEKKRSLHSASALLSSIYPIPAGGLSWHRAIGQHDFQWYIQGYSWRLCWWFFDILVGKPLWEISWYSIKHVMKTKSHHCSQRQSSNSCFHGCPV